MFTTPPPPGLGYAHVVQVAVGKEHGLLLTDEGVVYSWGGRNDHGQLGRPHRTEDQMQLPMPILERLRGEVVVQVACGAEHSMALTQGGILYAWGYNRAGQVGLTTMTSRPKDTEISVRNPTQVVFADDSVRVRSCGCAPESSACVTDKGEVYLWGAMSHFLFSNGTRYAHGENCTKPVRLRGVPLGLGCRMEAGTHQPTSVALCREQLACAVSPADLEEELAGYVKVLKMRSSQMLALSRGAQQAGPEQSRAANQDAFHSEDVSELGWQFGRQAQELRERLHELEAAKAACQAELSRIGRDITVCEQQDTALNESAADLEVMRGRLEGGTSSANTSARGDVRALDIKLNDNNTFRSATQRSRVALLEQRDQKERVNLRLVQEHTDAVQMVSQVESLARLIEDLQRGRLASGPGGECEEVLKVAENKRRELAATDPQVLAGRGQFTGFREVLSVSDHALGDIASALREVSASTQSSGADAALLEEVLEANLKLRKEINAHIQAKLEQAEKGRDRPGEQPIGGLRQFFAEAQASREQRWGGLAPRGTQGQDGAPISARTAILAGTPPQQALPPPPVAPVAAPDSGLAATGGRWLDSLTSRLALT